MSKELRIDRIKELLGLCVLATLVWFVFGGYGFGNATLPLAGNALMATGWLAIALRKGHWWPSAILRSLALAGCLTLAPLLFLVLAVGFKFGVWWIPVIALFTFFLGAAYAFISLSKQRSEVLL